MKLSEITRMGRRRFIKTVASLGVTGTALANISKSALAKSDIDLDNEVPVLMGWRHTNHQDVINGKSAPEREPVYTGISRDQWVKVERARDAAKQLRAELEGDGVDVGVTTITSGHTSKKAVIVRHITEEYVWGEKSTPNISFEDLNEKVPESVTGIAGRGTESASSGSSIPVIVKRTHHNPGFLKYEYDCPYRPVPAGCAYRTEDGNVCTTGTPVYDDEAGENRLVSAGHCFITYDSTECRQNKGSSNQIGSLVSSKVDFKKPSHSDGLFDAAVVDPDSGISLSWKRASNTCGEYGSHPIVGTMSDSWLHQLEDGSANISKQGARTGITSGPVDEVYDSWFRADLQMNNGDSGAPLYKHRTSSYGGTQTYIGGILRGGEDFAQATKMTEIEQRFNLTV